MAEVEATIEIPRPVAEVWELYFDRERWRNWVDGFARTTASEGYPEPGGTLSWESTPAGRGRVSERVISHEERRLHHVAYTDPGSEGEQEARFEMVPAGGDERRTRVQLRLDYRLHDAGPVSAITDRLFIRSQMRRSLQRSLVDLRGEVVAAAGGGAAEETD
jgi:uncharacterized protein YndB with AHSA1/START domain